MKSLKTFDQQIKDGDLFDIERAAKLTGYSVQHVRRLCHDRRIGHVRRGPQFFFTQQHIKNAFQYVEAQR